MDIKMSKNGLLFILMLLTATTLACSSTNVRTDFNRGSDFVLLRSFGWIQEPLPPPVPQGSPRLVLDNGKLRLMIEKSITYELTQNGFKLGLYGPPDFLIAYHAVSSGGVDISNWPYEHFSENADLHNYDKGTLIIDVINTESRRLIWRGSASNVFGGKGQPRKKIALAVREILKKFPPN